jgi:outer membrane lipoprotein-sorting protein
MKKLKKILLAGVLSLSLNSVASNTFVDFLKSFDSISADFELNAYGESLFQIHEEKGNFTFERPGKMVWNNKQKDWKLLMNSGQVITIDEEMEQIILYKDEYIQNTPLYWIITEADKLENIPKFYENDAGLKWYKTRKDGDSIKFGLKRGILSKIEISKANGQLIRVSIKNVRLNKKANQDIFKAKLNPDYDFLEPKT